MANEEHLEILRQGVEAWNQWRSENPETKPDLSEVDLREEWFSGADFRDVNFEGANLSYSEFVKANFTNAILFRANLSYACLVGADLTGATPESATLNWTNLCMTTLNNTNFLYSKLQHAFFKKAQFFNVILEEADMSHTNLNEARIVQGNLTQINFREADLSKAFFWHVLMDSCDFSDANLSDVTFFESDVSSGNFQRACLEKATFQKTHALRANFSEAVLTGACLAEWNIDRSTNLNDAVCEYFYLKPSFEERRPSDPNKIFTPGEFSALLQEAQETVDLIFSGGIDWKAFLTTFQELQAEYQDSNLAIQAIEKKSGGTFVVRLEVNPEIDKAIIESRATALYETELKVLEAQYRTELKAKETEIAIYRQQSADLMEIVKLQTTRPINVETKTVIEQSKSVEVEMNFHSTVTGATGANKGIININASEQRQTLAEAAAEIQRLLKQLEETNPSATEVEQIAYVDVAAKPDLKQRAIAALKAGGDTAIDEFFLENKYLKVGKAVVKAWIQPGS